MYHLATPVILIYLKIHKNIESEAYSTLARLPRRANTMEIAVSYDKEKAKGWRKVKVREMNKDQRAAYEESLARQRKARQEKRAAAAEEAKTENFEFAKQSQRAMKKFPLPFEQHFTQEAANKILMWMTCGGDLADVCAEKDVPDYPVVMQWIRPYLPCDEDVVGEDTMIALEYFRSHYVEARKNKLEKELDDIIRISDQATNKENSAAAKIRVSARVTMLERINVQLFAPTNKQMDSKEDERPMQEVLADALEEVAARRRKRLGLAEDAKVVDVQQVREKKAVEA